MASRMRVVLLLALVALAGCRLDTKPLVVPHLGWASLSTNPLPTLKAPQETLLMPPADLETLPPASVAWRIALVLPTHSADLSLPLLTQGFYTLCRALKVQPVTFSNLSAALAAHPAAICVVEPALPLATITQKVHQAKALSLFCAANNALLYAQPQSMANQNFDGFIGTDAFSAGRMCGLAIMDLLPNGGNVLAIGSPSALLQGLVSSTFGQLTMHPTSHLPITSGRKASFSTDQGFVCLDPAQMPLLQQAFTVQASLRSKPVVGYGGTLQMRAYFTKGYCEGWVAPPSGALGAGLAALAVGLLEGRLPKGRQVLLASEGYLRPIPLSNVGH